ncbi:AraC family transcriptional regulator [Sphingomonas sp. R-74633]|nr:AraC family transcriptional regulator [Sphingomonas sp. R-74633]NYT40381.1 AraC family transcriptional regulator [Sphingomonas sp. R-74633]
MGRVLDHIDAQLDGDLGTETLAAVAAFSRFHFHRQFAELFGISVHRYVQLARLKRASLALAYRTDPVLDIALDSGFGGPEAFARAFRQRIGQSPSAFRAGPDWAPWTAALAPLEQARSQHMTPTYTDADVRIVDFPATPVALIEHRGDPMAIGDTIRRFIAWRRANGLPPARSATFNILHNDPDSVPSEEHRLDIACAAGRVAPNHDGVTEGLIPAGRCAVVRLTGPGDDLRAPAHFLYADWLPRSGEELRDFPMFAERVKFFPDVPANEAVTEIYLPLN